MLASFSAYLQSENEKAAKQEGGLHTSATGLPQPDAGGFLSKLSGGGEGARYIHILTYKYVRSR